MLSEVSPNGSIDYPHVHGTNSPTTTSIIEDVESEHADGYEPGRLWEDAALRRYITDSSRHERLTLGVALGLAAARKVGEQVPPTTVHSTEQGTASSISLFPFPNAEDEGNSEDDNDIMVEVARAQYVTP